MTIKHYMFKVEVLFLLASQDEYIEMRTLIKDFVLSRSGLYQILVRDIQGEETAFSAFVDININCANHGQMISYSNAFQSLIPDLPAFSTENDTGLKTFLIENTY